MMILRLTGLFLWLYQLPITHKINQQPTNNLIEQISHRQRILLLEQISNNHQPA
jgi:hypothetical protein